MMGTPAMRSASPHASTSFGATRKAICSDSAPGGVGASLNIRPRSVSANKAEPTRYAIHCGPSSGLDRELHDLTVEPAHRRHVAREDDGVVDVAYLSQSTHPVHPMIPFVVAAGQGPVGSSADRRSCEGHQMRENAGTGATTIARPRTRATATRAGAISESCTRANQAGRRRSDGRAEAARSRLAERGSGSTRGHQSDLVHLDGTGARNEPLFQHA